MMGMEINSARHLISSLFNEENQANKLETEVKATKPAPTGTSSDNVKLSHQARSLHSVLQQSAVDMNKVAAVREKLLSTGLDLFNSQTVEQSALRIAEKMIEVDSQLKEHKDA